MLISGPDCSLSSGVGVWEIVQTDSPPAGRASHAAVVNGNEMWLFGGYSLSLYEYHDLYRWDICLSVCERELERKRNVLNFCQYIRVSGKCKAIYNGIQELLYYSYRRT